MGKCRGSRGTRKNAIMMMLHRASQFVFILLALSQISQANAQIAEPLDLEIQSQEQRIRFSLSANELRLESPSLSIREKINDCSREIYAELAEEFHALEEASAKITADESEKAGSRYFKYRSLGKTNWVAIASRLGGFLLRMPIAVSELSIVAQRRCR